MHSDLAACWVAPIETPWLIATTIKVADGACTLSTSKSKVLRIYAEKNHHEDLETVTHAQ
jgi:hypothetical protein